MNTPPILRDKIHEVLAYDALAQAEKLTGQSYKEDEVTSIIGMGLHMEHTANKRALLELAGDTHYSMAWSDFKKLIVKTGFEIQFVEPFTDREGLAEEAICAWDPRRAALLWAESYGLSRTDSKYPPGLNSGNVYFNWRANEGESHWSLSHVSGGMTETNGIFSIHYDVREGFLHHLDEVESKGRFETRWTKAPFLWLLTYMDTKVEGYDYKAITSARLAKLPAQIREAMGV